MKKSGAGVLILRNLERWKFLVAEGRQKLVDNFYSALSVEQNQVPRGSIFPPTPIHTHGSAPFSKQIDGYSNLHYPFFSI